MPSNQNAVDNAFSLYSLHNSSAMRSAFSRIRSDTGFKAVFTVAWVITACTAMGVICAHTLDHENVIMIYLLGLTYIATRCGIAMCAFASALSVWAFDFFIVPPVFQLLPADPQFLFTFALMFIVALTVSILVTHQTRAQQLLREQSVLLDLTNDAIVEWDISSQKILFWNSGAERLFDLPAPIALGQKISVLICGGYPQPINLLIAGALETGQWSGEVTYKRLDGIEVCVSSRWTVKTDENGKPSSIVEFATDMTDRRNAEIRVKEFYSTVSHELRTPLTSIRGGLLLIEKGVIEPESAEGAELIQLARTQADRLMVLINDILDLQKIESGKFELFPSQVDIDSIVSSVVAELRQMANQVNIALVQDIKCNPTIEADSLRIAQVLTNLVANAIKFSPPGSEIKVNAELREKKLRVSVIDHGQGIAQNQMSKLFGRFQQLDSSDRRSFGGTGLGLAISKAIVEQHDGVIGVESELGKGSVFWFELNCLQSGN